MFWGVREMKRMQILKVMRPQVIVDISYDVKMLSDGKKHRKIRSRVCENAFRNPNFESQVVCFNVV